MSDAPITDLLFVYGTLRPGARNPYADRLRAATTYLGPGWLPGRLYRIDWYPGAVYDPATTSRIRGDVLTLHQPATLLPWLDAYEDTGGPDPLYVRRVLPITLVGHVCPAWVYLYNQPTDHLVSIEAGEFDPGG